MLRRNPGLKLLALAAAVSLWYSVTKTERDAERIIELPVSLRKIPDGLTVTNPPTKAVSVTLRGPRAILDNVDERKSRLLVNLASLQLGDNRVDLNGTMMNPDLPRSLKAIRFEPPSLTLLADRLAMRRLPVRADLAGAPALGYTVAESTVAPDMVEVTGPARMLAELKQVTTEPIELRGASATVERNVLLDRPDQALTFVPDVVRVTVTLEEAVAAREFPGVPIQVPAEVKGVVPPTVDLTVRGSQRLLHNLKLEPEAVHLAASDLKPGKHTVDVVVDLPKGLTLLACTPPQVTVRVGGGR